ncbi:hypothetical protein acdb102_43890 [Acidothermaceae bacterium B102]|nr:hypothetical protein acdb102_43890 [Acidothermaceae bacterium B102]
MVTGSAVGPRPALVERVKRTIAAGLLCGIAGIALSDAGGPSAALLDVALLGLALWLGRSSLAQVVTTKPSNSAMTGNQALLLVLALGGAAVLIAAGAASRPLHGLAVAPFAMAAFALSSQNSRDLRSGVLAGAASLLVLSAADARAVVMTLCAVGLVPMVFAWAAVRQLMLLDRQPDVVLAVTPGPRPWPWALVARLVVVTAAVALLMPTEPAPRLHGGEGDAGSTDQSTPDPGERGNAIAGAYGGLNLFERGGLDAKPTIDVPAGSPTLWQGGFVDLYTGAGWSLSYPGTARARSVVLPTHQAMRDGDGYSIATVDRLAAGPAGVLFSPGPLVAADADAGTLFSIVTGVVAIVDRDNPVEPYTINYRDPGTTTQGTLGLAPAPVSDARWIQLTAELPARVRDLARTVTADATTTADKVAAVESYLRAHEKYSLDSPVPAAGTDAVDAFLFTDHVGFCEQFASAEAVMLRSLGIPTRVATGYGGSGEPLGDRRVYRNEDAHAWVQVGYSGGRWVNSDPTAGSRLAPATAKHRLTAWLKRLWKQLTGSATARRLLALGLVVLAVLVVLLARALRRLRPWRRPLAAAEPPVPPTPAGAAYHRLLGRLAAQQRPRLPTETVRDLLFRLGVPDRDVVVTVLETEWYGPPEAFPEAVVARVVAVLDGVALEALVSSSP